MKEATIIWEPTENVEVPLYYRLSREPDCQPAYVEIDLIDGSIDANYDPEPSNSNTVPFEIALGTVVRFEVSPYLKNDSLAKLLAEIQPIATKLINSVIIEQTSRGYYVPHLQDAQEYVDAIERECDVSKSDDLDSPVYSMLDWALQGGSDEEPVFIGLLNTEGCTEAVMKRLKSEAKEDGCRLVEEDRFARKFAEFIDLRKPKIKADKR